MQAQLRSRCALIVSALLANFSIAAENWTHWRGPEQIGIYRSRSLFESWTPAGRNVVWKSPVGGRATPIVLNGRIYLNCAVEPAPQQDRKLAGERVICWDAENGRVLWQDRFNVFQTDISVERVGWASMAGDAETGQVYMHSVSGLLCCYSADGKRLWERSLAEEFGKISGYGGRTQPPIIDEDRVIVGFLALNWGDFKAPPPKHYYYAFDKRSGRLLWVAAPGGKPLDTTYSTPIVREIDGERMLIAGNADGACYAMKARNGELLWKFRMSRRGINTSPVCDGKYVYICHGEDNIDTAAFGRVQCIDASGRGDITESHSVWRADGLPVGYASPLVHNKTLYVVTTSGTLHALDAAKGTRIWKHNLGTVGRGSPVWADGKLYVTERDGNVHILQPSREACRSLSHVYLAAATGNGHNVIHASFAFANGRGFLVTRDATYCLADLSKAAVLLPPSKEQTAGTLTGTLARLQIVPYSVDARAGQKWDYQVLGYDRLGRLIGPIDAAISTSQGLPSVAIQGRSATVRATNREQAGTVVARVGNLSARARLRVFPKLPWKWDFEELSGKQVPSTWVRAFLKLQPAEIDGSTVLRNSPGPGRPSTYVWLGPSTMNGYTVQADVMARDQRRRMSNIGVTAMRYNLILKGNAQALEVQSWASVTRMAKQVPFKFAPDTWYRLKLRVDLQKGKAIVRGKVWPRSESEPPVWSIEVDDPQPNLRGSPGLYLYSLADSYFDNVVVTPSD